MMRWMAVVAMVVALSGCTPYESPEVTLTCRAGKNCEIVWDKAWKWVDDNSDRAIQHLDSHRIMTTPPTDGNSADLAYSITKRAISGDKYKIVFVAWCTNFIGCGENPVKKSQKFVEYMTH